MKDFGLKFMDIMMGVVLGLGFSAWENLQEPWQYLAFIFAYLSIVDYWADTSPALRKYPPKRELDLLLDIAVMFLLSLLIYATRQNIIYLLAVFSIYRVFDSAWTLRILNEYQLNQEDKLIFRTWLLSDIIDITVALLLIFVFLIFLPPPLIVLLIFVGFRIISRILSSVRYQRVYFS